MRIVAGTGLYWLYNQVCEGDCSRYDVAVEFVRLLGLEGRVRVTQVDSDYFREEYFAPRPASEKLVNMKLHARGFATCLIGETRWPTTRRSSRPRSSAPDRAPRHST